MWMEVKSVIQTEVSQKEKSKYCVLTLSCEIQKNGADEPICSARIQIHRQSTDMQTWGGEGEGGMNWKTGNDI